MHSIPRRFHESAVRLGIAVLTLAAGATVLIAAQAPATPTQAAAGSSVTLPRGNVDHGRYIAEQVAMCVECHSGRDAQGNIVPSQRYLGSVLPIAPPPWGGWATNAPRNKGLPGYTDALALRLLTQGSIGRDGAQLRPPMPRFRMSAQDAADVIAFLRAAP
jgi:hypothetical protein